MLRYVIEEISCCEIQQESIDKLLKEVSAEEISKTITELSAFYTRYYTSTTGVDGTRILSAAAVACVREC
jgi:hypothetical protein